LPDKIDLSQNRKGLYLYVIYGDNGYIQRGKIMKKLNLKHSNRQKTVSKTTIEAVFLFVIAFF